MQLSISNEYLKYLKDQFSVLSGVTVRKMFGGVGVFRHGLMFALSTKEGGISLKADDQTIPQFEEEGCSEWVYENSKSKKRVSMNYWYAPEFVFEDPDELKKWAEKAFEAAVRFDQKKPASQRKLKL